jgi:hypothetical protein
MNRICAAFALLVFGLVLLCAPATAQPAPAACFTHAGGPAPAASSSLPPQTSSLSKTPADKPPAQPIFLATVCYCQYLCSDGSWGAGWSTLVECGSLFTNCCHNSGSWSCT